jgi:uncharacterized membrane protein
MNLEPLISASPIIQIHAFAAIAALGIGISQLAFRKGTFRHRILGYVWSGFMLLVALSSLFIHEIRMYGLFSPIHFLSLGVLCFLPLAIWRAWRGNFKGHGRTMKITFWSALVIAGFFTLMPNRIMGQVFFGP